MKFSFAFSFSLSQAGAGVAQVQGGEALVVVIFILIILSKYEESTFIMIVWMNVVISMGKVNQLFRQRKIAQNGLVFPTRWFCLFVKKNMCMFS